LIGNDGPVLYRGPSLITAGHLTSLDRLKTHSRQQVRDFRFRVYDKGDGQRQREAVRDLDFPQGRDTDVDDRKFVGAVVVGVVLTAGGGAAEESQVGLIEDDRVVNLEIGIGTGVIIDIDITR